MAAVDKASEVQRDIDGSDIQIQGFSNYTDRVISNEKDDLNQARGNKQRSVADEINKAESIGTKS